MTPISIPAPPSPGGVAAHPAPKTLPALFFDTLLLHKQAAARANQAIGTLPVDLAQRIMQAVDALRRSAQDPAEMPSLWQSGCGLECNRWANERIAATAHDALQPAVDPALVNRNQSTNDTMPTVIQVSLLRAHREAMRPAQVQLGQTLRAKASAFPHAYVMGRTFLRDARRMPAAQVFSAWAALLHDHDDWLAHACARLTLLPQGGYSLGHGDGINPRFAPAYIEALNEALHPLVFGLHPEPSTAMAGIGAIAGVAGALASVASGLEKIAHDILLLCSGPDGGFNELDFAGTHNDSTTLARKSNPKEATTVHMACAYSRALCTMVVDLAARGQLQLYTAFPITAYALLESMDALAGRMTTLAQFIDRLSPRHKEFA